MQVRGRIGGGDAYRADFLPASYALALGDFHIGQKAIAGGITVSVIDFHRIPLPPVGTDDHGYLAAGSSMDPTDLFEAAHAVKGVAANLGLTKLSDVASEITEDFRPGNERKLSDEDVKQRIETIRELHEQIVYKIRKYIELSE